MLFRSNWAVEKAFHKHPEAKEHRVTLNIKGHNQTEIYKKSKKFNAVHAGNLLRALSKDALKNEEAKRIHEERILTLSIEQDKSRQETMEKLIAAGLTGTDLKETLAIMFPSTSVAESQDGTAETSSAQHDKGAHMPSITKPPCSEFNVKAFIEAKMSMDPETDVKWSDVSSAYKGWSKQTFDRKTMWAEFERCGLTVVVKGKIKIEGVWKPFTGVKGWRLN